AGIDAAVLKEFAAMKVGVLAAQLHQFTRELEQRFGVVIELPVDPTDLVVLGVGVVVAGLRAADLVAAADHGYALRAEQGHQEIPLLPLAHIDDDLIVGGPFDAVVVGVVVIGAVAIVFAIGLIVFY